MKTFTNSVLNLRNIDKHQREIKSIVTSRCDQNKICAVRLEEISDKINFWVTSKKKNGGQHGPADCVWCVFFQSDESSLQKMYFVNNIWRYSCQEINRKCLCFGFQTDRKIPAAWLAVSDLRLGERVLHNVGSHWTWHGLNYNLLA